MPKLPFGWKPKEGLVYSPHSSAHENIVGQKVYVTTKVINRSVNTIISGQVFPGSFSVSEGICTIRVKSDKRHQFLTPVTNVKFDKKVSYAEGNGQNQYGTRFKYPLPWSHAF